MTLALCLSLMAAALAAQTPLTDRSLMQQADRRIRELQAETDRLATQARTLLGELRGLELARQIKVQEVRKAEAAREAVARELHEATARVAACLGNLRASWPDHGWVLMIGHRATHYALDHLLRGIPLADTISTPFAWQPGWTYEVW